MAAHSLSIAKASFLASCLRPDITKLSRDDLASFHTLLESSIARCTPSNVQNSKSWLLQHILPSAPRTTALSKYLASLSKNIAVLPGDQEGTRTCRRQLHLLYLINDIFHHIKHHDYDPAIRDNVQQGLQQVLSELFANAAAESKKRTNRRLNGLIDIWDAEKYCDAEVLTELRDAVTTGVSEKATKDNKDGLVTQTKELPWIMPAAHGDPTAPFFDLPAANLMPHIVPNSSRPMRPDQIRALHFTPGTADESLVNALKDFLKDVRSIDDPDSTLEEEGVVPEVDEIGQLTYKNEADDVVGDTYYGWSRAFCERMKKRAKEDDSPQRGRSRSPSSSRSRSRSQSPRKRRRYSNSSSRSRSRSDHRGRSSSHFEAWQGKYSPPLLQAHTFPAENRPSLDNGQVIYHQPPAPRLPPPLANVPFILPQMHGNGMPVPPPRPPNWQGPWPPPPPPPPARFPSQFAGLPFPQPPQNYNNQQAYGRR
ncbi:hypothetical protein LTS08_004682 [Lithohypha guttulata]|nr:hypothetical protein LTS08_004682 [Lithohypha guttulata]